MAIDKQKMQAALDKLNAELKASGKTLEEAEYDDKTEALNKMKTLSDDPKYAKLWNKKVNHSVHK
jgi:hypothetical protein